MKLLIRELDHAHIADLGRFDGEFLIEERLLLQAQHNQISYTSVPQPLARKRYQQEDLDYAAYIGSPDRVIFLAYVDDRAAGQIILRKNWNKFAYVEDLLVDVSFRRLGVGLALMDRAKDWARENRLPGIMLETQNNNVSACKFYERCGFEIGGFDKSLYRGLDADSDEIAVFWYFYLPGAVEAPLET